VTEYTAPLIHFFHCWTSTFNHIEYIAISIDLICIAVQLQHITNCILTTMVFTTSAMSMFLYVLLSTYLLHKMYASLTPLPTECRSCHRWIVAMTEYTTFHNVCKVASQLWLMPP